MTAYMPSTPNTLPSEKSSPLKDSELACMWLPWITTTALSMSMHERDLATSAGTRKFQYSKAQPTMLWSQLKQDRSTSTDMNFYLASQTGARMVRYVWHFVKLHLQSTWAQSTYTVSNNMLLVPLQKTLLQSKPRPVTTLAQHCGIKKPSMEEAT